MPNRSTAVIFFILTTIKNESSYELSTSSMYTKFSRWSYGVLEGHMGMHMGADIGKTHSILGSYGREMCVTTRATGSGAGLFDLDWDVLRGKHYSAPKPAG